VSEPTPLARGDSPTSEEPPADRPGPQPGPRASARAEAAKVFRALGRLDRAVYRCIARLPASPIDAPLRRFAKFADHSKPWFIVAAVLALIGGERGRRAALAGIAAIGVTSLVVNQPMKFAGDRNRPDREGAGVPQQRWVTMPESTSFPSGHSASAAAFAVAVGDLIPGAAPALRTAGSVVAFSRVYTGVHYPSDVVIGVIVGGLIGRLTSRTARRIIRSTAASGAVSHVQEGRARR
jgi:membrane-associated phospholipid phosphatase